MDILTLFISLRCTHACVHCLYGCSPQSGEHMPWDVFSHSVGIAKGHRIPALNFFGGEPLLNPRIFAMLQTALENDFHLILATNCRPLASEGFFARFLDITRPHKERIAIFTARDRFHLRFFDPAAVVDRLRNEEYQVEMQDCTDYGVLISPHNMNNLELPALDTGGTCCKAGGTDHLGVLPDGGWTICPPSLEDFGTIFSVSLDDIVEFKRGLPLKYKKGCTECLKDFKGFREQFQRSGASRAVEE